MVRRTFWLQSAPRCIEDALGVAGAIEETFGNACVAQAYIEDSNKDVSHGLALCDHEPGLATSFTAYKFDVRSEFGRIARSGHPAGLTSQFYDPLFSIGQSYRERRNLKPGEFWESAPSRVWLRSRAARHTAERRNRALLNLGCFEFAPIFHAMMKCHYPTSTRKLDL
jgi:hypothetical protein